MLVTGKAVGEKIGSGIVRVIATAEDLTFFQPGEVLVARSTSPDWEPVMKTAGAIVTDRGGRTCHAAIVARELGVPAVVGAELPRSHSRPECASPSRAPWAKSGTIYEGDIAVRSGPRADAGVLALPETEIMVNLGNPDLAFRTAMMPNAGVGLARMEFVISEHIGVHPMALVHPEQDHCGRIGHALRARTSGFTSPREFFVRNLAEGIGTIAAAFYPKPVIVRLSDFKTNEYAELTRRGCVRADVRRTRCSASVARPVMRILPMQTGSRWNARRCVAFARTWG